MISRVLKGEINGILFSNPDYLEKSFGEVFHCDKAEIYKIECYRMDNNMKSLIYNIIKFLKLNYNSP